MSQMRKEEKFHFSPEIIASCFVLQLFLDSMGC